MGREITRVFEIWLEIKGTGSGENMCGVQMQSGSGGGSGSKLLLIDGHAYAYRAFYAIRQLTGPGGRPTNAIYGFIKMLAKVRDQLKPTHLAVVWDGGLAQARVEAHPAYKANRPPMPADLETQLAEIGRYLAAAGIASIQLEGVEADDCLATLARQAAQDGRQVVIASSDKDFMQLVSSSIGLVNPGEAALRVWTPNEVREKTGVSPEQIVDWLSLVGDAVDNIPGAPGIGPKTATKLLVEFGSIAEMLRRIAEINPERLRAVLVESQAVMERNQQLIRLDTRVPLDTAWDRLACPKGEADAVKTLYREWGFRVKDDLAHKADDRNAEQDLFASNRV